MPKQRYDVMRAYMPTVGTRGLDMMQRTATVQANLDFADEADAAREDALHLLGHVDPDRAVGGSPIVDDKSSGYQSYRAWIWRDTDNARAGLLPFVFERDDIFTAYTEWALDVPMYFIYRGGYVPVAAGLTFRAFMRDGWQGLHATAAGLGAAPVDAVPRGPAQEVHRGPRLRLWIARDDRGARADDARPALRHRPRAPPRSR